MRAILSIALTSLVSSALLIAEPWGKDADLVSCKPCHKEMPASCSTPVMGPIGEALIRFHQEVISPADGPRSHFIPSSSQYALNAMRKYGFVQGVIMGCDRLMRENDEHWVYQWTYEPSGKLIKYDPVP